MSPLITLPRPASSPERHLARLLHPSAAPSTAPLATETLAVIADGLGRSLSLQDLVDGLGRARPSTRLLATAAYDAWLVTWGPSTVLELHDHGGSAGALRLVTGRLLAATTDLVSRTPLRSTCLDPGDTLTFAASDVHELWNPQQTPAVGVHVYSPPLTTTTYYDQQPETYLVPLRTEPAAHDLTGGLTS
jgi:hypothetical protein